MSVLKKNSLLEVSHHFEKLFDTLQDGILILNFATGKIEDANPYFLEFLGFTKQELVGKELWEIGPVLDKEAALAAFKILKGRGFIRYNNLPLLNKKGEVLEVEFISNVYDLDHHPIIQCIVRNNSKQKVAEKALADYKDAVSVSFEEMAGVFSSMIEKRDSYTSAHQLRVAQLVVAIAEQLKFDAHFIEGIRFSASIHDIGKIAIPSEILTKPDALNSFEIAMLRNHAQAGYDVVKNMKFPWPVAQTIYQHHERLDGSGYPNQLKGGDIIFEARILAVADTVEAMSSRRPYRTNPGLAAALETIVAGRGTLFQPEVVDACLEVFEHGFQFGYDPLPQTHESQHL